MSSIGPRDPELGTFEAYIARVAHTAPLPDPETMTRLAHLLRQPPGQRTAPEPEERT